MSNPPAGWYPNPGQIGYERYWDGKAWTNDRRKKPRRKSSSGGKRSTAAVGAPAPVQKVAPLATGIVGGATTLSIYRDGTFTTRVFLGRESARDRLLGFEHDTDSMRRKSVSGRGVAALATGGLSLVAANNRGVVYVTVIGERSGVLTYTTRNPSGAQLTSLRSLKAASEAVLSVTTAASSPTDEGGDVVLRLQQLTELHQTGALTSEEFAAAKARLLA